MRRTYRCMAVGFTLAGSLVFALSHASAQGAFAEQRVRFTKGHNSATLRGRVSQRKAILYIVGAKAGQSMTVSLDGDAKTRFDLSGPKDKSGQTMANGESEWSDTLPDNGDYRILVFTDSRVASPFTLKITIE
jgi:hypothetical protein